MVTNRGVLGIDGCRAGWAVVRYDGEWDFQISSDLHSLKELLLWSEVSLIDIPIGLSGNGIKREVDKELRRALSPIRHHAVFTPPCRKAVYAADYTEARQINKSETGKSISIQAWNITSKIREADELLISTPALSDKLLEAHPEFCFKKLHADQHLKHGKKARAQAGIKERLKILEKHLPKVRSFFHQIESDYRRKDLALDDILDAICLCLHAHLGTKKGFDFLKSRSQTDAQGIPMRLAVAAIQYRI
ncbi:MAG: DUF429 domain-containing protein [Bacteroidetes bacterium]|nr:DUF429 domain-containing protein [Bacteroidota bacterium]